MRISLSDAVEIAMNQSLSVRKAHETLTAKEARYKQSLAAFLPSLGASSSYSRSFDEANGYDLSGGRDWTQQTGLRLSWSLWEGGARWANLAQQAASRRVTEQDGREIEEETLLSVISAYVVVVRARENLDVAQESLRLAQESRAQGQALLSVGKATKSDVLRADVEVSLRGADVLSARAALQDAQTELCDVLNIERAAVSVEKPRFREVVVPELAACLDVGSSTPTVQAYRALLDMAEAGKKAAKAAYLPTLSTSATCAWSGKAYEFGDPDYSVGLSVSWSLFEGGERHYRVQEAAVNQRIAQLDLESGTRQVRSAIESDHGNLGYAISLWESAKRTLELAEESYDQLKEMFELGMATSLELFSAQETLNEARLGEVSRHYDVIESYATLLSDMGQLGQTIRRGDLYYD
jgi:outer membrane protein